MKWAVITVFLLGCGGSGPGFISQHSLFQSSRPQAVRPHPAVAAQPVIARVGERTPMILRGRLSRARARAVRRTVERTRRDFLSRLPTTAQIETRPVDIVVFRSARAYRRFAHSIEGAPVRFRGGFYMSDRRLVAVNLSAGMGNLRHEVIHPLLKDAYPDVPAWLDEGLASLYAGAWYRRGRYVFGSDHRIRHLRRALRRGRVPTLRKLSSSTWADVHGADERTYYATGRYLLLYVERRGKLRAFLREMFSGDLSAERQLRTLRRHVPYWRFLRWLR